MARRNPEHRAQTRRRIIDAFWGLYAKLPVREIKVKAVTDAAGCNRSTFYQYFDSMDDLHAQAEDELLAKVDRHVSASDPAMSTEEVVAGAAAFFDADGGRITTACSPVAPEGFDRRLFDQLVPWVLDALSLDPDDPEDLFVTSCVAASTLSTILLWEQMGRPVSSERLARMLAANYTSGVIPAFEHRAGDAARQGEMGERDAAAGAAGGEDETDGAGAGAAGAAELATGAAPAEDPE